MTVPEPSAPVRPLAVAPPAEESSLHSRALQVIGSVVAPAGLLTALMYYFGLLHAYWFFGRFGVDYTLMGLTTQDYLVRSADGLFVPLTAVAAVGLASIWLSLCVSTTTLRRARRLVRPSVLRGVTVLLALTVLAVAVAGLLGPKMFAGSVGVPGVSLVVSVVLLTVVSRSGHRRRRLPPAVLIGEWMAIFVLVSTGAFWAVGDYSAEVGTRRGNDVIAALPTWSDAIVYSEKSLNLALPGVHEQRCTGEDAAFNYRYDGMKLIVESGGPLLLLPSEWHDGTSIAVVLPRSDTLRLEFTGAGQAVNTGC